VDRLPGNISYVKIKEDQKTQIISEMIENKVDIVGVDLVRPTLEEIFYHIRMK
jgi:hypothetical protein